MRLTILLVLFVAAIEQSSGQTNLKTDCPQLNLSFIENAIPEGEGEKEYLNPSVVKDQMELFSISVQSFLKKGIKKEDVKLLEDAKRDAERLVALCEFAMVKNLLISIGLDA
jgi:hypothetical protein